MRSLTTKVAVLGSLLAGCSCGTHGAADAGQDAGLVSTLDAATDGSVDGASADAFVQPDAAIAAPLCAPILADGCPVQSAEAVSGCTSGEGVVFFDGSHCQESPSRDCGPERGAFRSFEECAVACEAAGYCDPTKIFYNTGEMPGCETPSGPTPACAGAWDVLTWIPLDPSCEALGSHSRCYGSPLPLRCVTANPDERPTWDEAWTLFRRASLLPFVTRLECGLGF